MAEQLLEEIPGIKQEDNRTVSQVTGDPNPVHDEKYMAHIEYAGKVYHKKPLIMGTIIETLGINAITKRFGKVLHLNNLLTDFRGFLYPDEPFQIYLTDIPGELPVRFKWDETYTATLRKKGKDFASVTLGFTDKKIELSEARIAEDSLLIEPDAEKIAGFAKATNSRYVQDFMLASRSRAVAENLQNPNYPQLACLSNPDLFPVYSRHHAIFSRYMRSLTAENKVSLSLAAELEDKKRPDVYTEVCAFSDLEDPLFISWSHIATIPRAVALGKFIEDI